MKHKEKIFYKKGDTVITLDERAKSLFDFWKKNSDDIFMDKLEYNTLHYSEQNFSTFPNYIFSDENFSALKKELGLPEKQNSIEILADTGDRKRVCEIYSQTKFDAAKKEYDQISKRPKVSFGTLMSVTEAISYTKH